MAVGVGVAVAVAVGVGVGVSVAVAVGVGVAVAVAVGVGVGVSVAVGVGVGVLELTSVFVWKEVTVATPPCVSKRMPAKPDVSEVSVAVAIHPLGSDPEDAQTLAVRVEPTTRKWMV